MQTPEGIPCQSAKCFENGVVMEYVPTLSDNMQNTFICRQCGKGAKTKTRLAKAVEPMKSLAPILAVTIAAISVMNDQDNYFDGGAL